MSASANPDNDVAVPCANDCGFWGRPSTNNFCSSCYKTKIGELKNNSSSSSSNATSSTGEAKTKAMAKANKFDPQAQSESKMAMEVESKLQSEVAASAEAASASGTPLSITKRTQANVSTDAAKTAAQEGQTQTKALAVKDLSIKDNNTPATAVVSENLEEKEKPVERKVQKTRTRCFHCNKKVGLTGMECRCGYVFCGKHRYPEEHTCHFDYHKFAKTNLSNKASKSGAVVDKIQGEKL